MRRKKEGRYLVQVRRNQGRLHGGKKSQCVLKDQLESDRKKKGRRFQAVETAGAESGGCKEQQNLGIAHGSLWQEQKLEKVEVRGRGRARQAESWIYLEGLSQMHHYCPSEYCTI